MYSFTVKLQGGFPKKCSFSFSSFLNLKVVFKKELKFPYYISSRIFYNIIAKWTFLRRTECNSWPLLFSLLLFSLSSLFLDFGASRAVRNMPFDAFSLRQMTANFVRLVFKKSARYIVVNITRLKMTRFSYKIVAVSKLLNTHLFNLTHQSAIKQVDWLSLFGEGAWQHLAFSSRYILSLSPRFVLRSIPVMYSIVESHSDHPFLSKLYHQFAMLH